MHPQDGSDGFPWLRPGARFPDTRPSILERLRAPEPETRSQAFGELVRGYWKPTYKYLRYRWHQEPADAEDSTQAFLAAAHARDWFEGFDPSRARFRTFLRVCLDRFVMNQRQSAQAARRGGGTTALPLDFAGAEQELHRSGHSPGQDEDRFFRQELLRDLFARALAEVRAACEAGGRQTPFRVFERYDIAQPDGVTYADLAREFGVPATQVTNYLAAMRRQFRAAVLEQLRRVCGSDAEFRDEARELFGIEVA